MMKRAIYFIFFILITIGVSAQKEGSNVRSDANLNKPERQEWLRDLGFGMFIHWSFDSQLGIESSHSMAGASDDYMNRLINELPKTFNPDKFDAYQMVKLARLAGMKYVVLTTKHHSGFCLWDTQTTDFKITNTPYGKDLLKEYVAGVRKAGLAVGFYYSPEDFKFLYDNHIVVNADRDLGGLIDKKTEAAYHDLIRRQTRELFTNYGKIDVLFIDGGHKQPCKEEAWKLQPDLVITRGAVDTPEQRLPGVARNSLWESCITMGTQWQYKPTNDHLKSGGRLIDILIETRAKGGNLLLNVGPHPDGYIVYEEEIRLREIAAWHFINHEAIENVRPWIIPNEENVWFTAAKDRKTVYAIITGITDWVRGDRKEFVLGSVQSTPETRISVLGQNDKVIEYQQGKDPKSYFRQEADGLHISGVRAQIFYNNGTWTFPISIKLENVIPALDPPVVETLDAKFSKMDIKLMGNLVRKGNARTVKVGFEYHPYSGFTESLYNISWTKTQFVEMNNEGHFIVDLPGFERKKEYEFRAVVIHPQMSIRGDTKRFQVK